MSPLRVLLRFAVLAHDVPNLMCCNSTCQSPIFGGDEELVEMVALPVVDIKDGLASKSPCGTRWWRILVSRGTPRPSSARSWGLKPSRKTQMALAPGRVPSSSNPRPQPPAGRIEASPCCGRTSHPADCDFLDFVPTVREELVPEAEIFNIAGGVSRRSGETASSMSRCWRERKVPNLARPKRPSAVRSLLPPILPPASRRRRLRSPSC